MGSEVEVHELGDLIHDLFGIPERPQTVVAGPQAQADTREPSFEHEIACLQYHASPFRIRSSSRELLSDTANLDADVYGGLTSGAYQFQVRLPSTRITCLPATLFYNI